MDRLGHQAALCLLRPEGGAEFFARKAPVAIGISGREVLRNRRVRLRFLLRDAAAVIRIERVED